MRRLLRAVLVTAVVAVTLVSVAWATIGLAPLPSGPDATGGTATHPGDVPTADELGVEEQRTEELIARSRTEETGGASPDRAEAGPADGQVLVGTSVVDITPDPPDGERWQTEDCATGLPNEEIAGTRKTTTPDCIYMGGRGLGPSEPVTHVEADNPLEVRTVAIGDGADTAVLTQIDGVYWHGRYDTLCDRCGALDIADDLSDDLGLPTSAFFIAANHSHNSPDFIGAWGGVPGWYMEQTGEAIRTSIREALEDRQPAVLQAGESFSRSLNVQRRDTYYSPEDAGFSWARAVAVNRGGQPTGDTLAVVSTFSAHPVTSGYDGGRGHADWPGRFSQLVRDHEQAVGISFVAGLGNMSTRQGTEDTAQGIYALLPDPKDAGLLDDVDVDTAQVGFDQPISNLGLVALRAGLFFDRTTSGPAAVSTGRHPDRQCRSASAQSVQTVVSAARIGPDLLIAAGPGELFSNLTNTLKDQHPSATVLPLANVNDGLGYIMQSFEEDAAGRQALGFTDGPVEYEEAFSLDACFGDLVLDSALGLLAALTDDG